jgi:hypothetical protein
VFGTIVAPTKWALVIAGRRDRLELVGSERGWKKVDWWRHVVDVKNESFDCVVVRI